MKLLESGAPSAPALLRGLELLDLLAREGQHSLERLHRATGWPKSSLLRYLGALEERRAVAQDPVTGVWKAIKVLRPVSDAGGEPMMRARGALPVLADRTACCSELYEVGGRLVRLIDRAEPEGTEIRVVARIGFERDLHELDSTAAIFYAFRSRGRPPSGMWWHVGGRREKLDAAKCKAVVGRVHREGIAVDYDFNSNGIRRTSVPVRREDGKLSGIISVAQHQTPRAESVLATIRHALLEEKQHIENRP